MYFLHAIPLKKKMRERVLENFTSSHQVPKTSIHSTAYGCPNLPERLVTQ